jgi:hypothetical protein
MENGRLYTYKVLKYNKEAKTFIAVHPSLGVVKSALGPRFFKDKRACLTRGYKDTLAEYRDQEELFKYLKLEQKEDLKAFKLNLAEELQDAKADLAEAKQGLFRSLKAYISEKTK